MSVPRFCVSLALAPGRVGETIELPDAVAHHAVRVTRLVVGDALTLFTGEGGEYASTIARIDKRGAAVRIDRYDAIERESALPITLAQAIAATDAMDYAVRKATELGAAAIAPVVTARSAPLPSGTRGERRHAHWREIAVAACEQCGRNRIPDVASPVALSAWLAGWQGDGAVLDPTAERSLAALSAPKLPFAVLIGPEGGLAPAEIAAAKRAGFAGVRLGPRVLRTETAGVAVLAAMQAMWGDMQ
jgi:16S rRNA (uracil1498-N3)-methyltransferase